MNGGINKRNIAALILIGIGIILAFKGAVDANQKMINAGIGGMFLGIIVLTFSSSDYIKYDTFNSMISPYVEFTREIIEALNLRNKSIYIPPYENLKDGGIFIPVHNDFDLDLAKLDEDTVFITDVGREKEMGLLLKPIGKELMRIYEDFLEIELGGADLAIMEGVSDVLKSLRLAKSLVLDEKNGEIKIQLTGVNFDFCSKYCETIACPLCSSILLSISKILGELILVESFSIDKSVITIHARKIGGVDDWM